MASKLEGILGFARRAGKLTYGTDAVRKDVALGKAYSVILSADASERTIKVIRNTCTEAEIPGLQVLLSKQELGACIGRGDTAVAAVIDRSFSKRVVQLGSAVPKEDDGE